MTTNSSKQAAIKVAHTTQEGATDGDENESAPLQVSAKRTV